MRFPFDNKPIRTILPVAAILVLALAARIIPGPRTIDDAFITYRYARNLIAGNGFVFNPGEPVQGTTTPLYSFLLTALALPAGGTQAPFPWLALGLNAAADALTCLMLWRIGQRLGSGRAGLAAALVWAVAPFSVTFAIGGLETSLYVLLLVTAAWAYLAEKNTLSAAAAGLSILTRPDAVLLAAPLILDRLYRAWRASKTELGSDRLKASELAAFCLPVIAWAVFATIYFGSPFPHSVTAKLAVYRLEPYSALIRLLQHYATPFLENNWSGPVGIGFGLFAYPFFSWIGALRAVRFNARAWPLMVYPWVYFLAFALPNPLIFRWYLTPPLPFYFLAIFFGLERLIQSAVSRRMPGETAGSAVRSRLACILILVFLFILPLGSSLTGWRLRLDHGPARPAPEMAFIKLELLYQQAAEHVASELTPGSILAAGDVGVLGFASHGQILDTVGLNSPVSLEHYPLAPDNYVINYAIPTSLILTQKPDLLIILEVYGRKTLLADPRFLQQYTLVDTLSTDIYGSRGMVIYRKNPQD